MHSFLIEYNLTSNSSHLSENSLLCLEIMKISIFAKAVICFVEIERGCIEFQFNGVLPFKQRTRFDMSTLCNALLISLVTV